MTVFGKIVDVLTARHHDNEVIARGVVGSDGATYNTVRLYDGRVVDIRTGGYVRRRIGEREAVRRGMGKRETIEDVYADGTSVACMSVYCGKRESVVERIYGDCARCAIAFFKTKRPKGK